ncbi:hypothetical protein Poli38472_014598 [Pythium oligandrum]|uniref:Uncharacterized protein n=1 Tax=Pythium oligandrum TaxID=41045 RepID=A0A8K1CN49_PYTOL|nr:hypothetical protein Poli38472_014598 [Pythium oligandrum]|eukprot:TMW66622.1 hypothetical protein Poli38472_014598 [Pythium oligandrum]
MTLEAAEDVLERACFLQPHKNPIMDIVDARFGETGDNALVLTYAQMRASVSFVVWWHHRLGYYSPSCVQKALEKLPVDVRVAMVENLVVLGGTTMLHCSYDRPIRETDDAQASVDG